MVDFKFSLNYGKSRTFLSLWASNSLSFVAGFNPFYIMMDFKSSHHGEFWVLILSWWISNPLSTIVGLTPSPYDRPFEIYPLRDTCVDHRRRETSLILINPLPLYGGIHFFILVTRVQSDLSIESSQPCLEGLLRSVSPLAPIPNKVGQSLSPSSRHQFYSFVLGQDVSPLLYKFFSIL